MLIENAPPEQMSRICTHLVEANQAVISRFFEALDLRLGRHIIRVIVTPLYGRVNEFATIEAALQFLERYMTYEGSGEFRRYEVRVEFSNGDKVEAFLEAKETVKEFLCFVSKQ